MRRQPHRWTPRASNTPSSGPTLSAAPASRSRSRAPPRTGRQRHAEWHRAGLDWERHGGPFGEPRVFPLGKPPDPPPTSSLGTRIWPAHPGLRVPHVLTGCSCERLGAGEPDRKKTLEFPTGLSGSVLHGTSGSASTGPGVLFRAHRKCHPRGSLRTNCTVTIPRDWNGCKSTVPAAKLITTVAFSATAALCHFASAPRIGFSFPALGHTPPYSFHPT